VNNILKLDRLNIIIGGISEHIIIIKINTGLFCLIKFIIYIGIILAIVSIKNKFNHVRYVEILIIHRCIGGTPSLIIRHKIVIKYKDEEEDI